MTHKSVIDGDFWKSALMYIFTYIQVQLHAFYIHLSSLQCTVALHQDPVSTTKR